MVRQVEAAEVGDNDWTATRREEAEAGEKVGYTGADAAKKDSTPTGRRNPKGVAAVEEG